MTVLTAENITTRPSSPWQKEDVEFTGNDVIDAYYKGKEDGKSEQNQINRRVFEGNLKTSQCASEKILLELREQKIGVKGLHLRANSLTSWDALFVIDSKDYLREQFRDIHSLARKLKNEIRSSTFDISFIFTPYSSKFDNDCVGSDAFFLKYHGKRKASKK